MGPFGVAHGMGGGGVGGGCGGPPFLKFSHTPYIDKTWHNYTLPKPKEDPKSI